MLYYSMGEARKEKVVFIWSLIWLELLADNVRQTNKTKPWMSFSDFAAL